jgi:hypothetical protein
MLGDTIEAIEKHYTPFVKKLRERVRARLETGVGHEELALKAAEQPQIAPKRPNLQWFPENCCTGEQGNTVSGESLS